MQPTIKEIDLAPKHPVLSQFAETIAYLGGDLPTIVIHVHGRKFELLAGQCIPVYGKQFSIENQYNRSARVQVVFNAPVNTTATGPTDAQKEFVTYRNSYFFGTDPVTATNTRGVAFLAQENRYLISWGGGNDMHVSTINDAKPNFLDFKPAAFMAEPAEVLEHPTGDTLPDLLTINGYYSAADMSAWLTAAGMSYEANVKQPYYAAYGGEIIVEPGVALFLSRWAGTTDFKTQVKVRDLGNLNGNAYV